MNEEKTIDLNALDTKKGSDDGFELTLLHPQTGEALPAKVRILGVDSEAYQRTQRNQNRRRLEKQARNRRYRTTLEEVDAELMELVVAVTVGWSGMALDGKPFEYTAENAKVLYTRCPWAFDQVQAAVVDRGNFLPRSATS